MVSKFYEELPSELGSHYLERGFATEQLTLKNVELDLENRSAKALIDVEADFENLYGIGGNAPFHFSTLTAYRAVGQLAMGYFNTEAEKLGKNVGSFMLTESVLSPKRLIEEHINIPLEINFPKYLKRPTRLAGNLEFNIDEGSFLGDIRFLVGLQDLKNKK